jgi:NAD(P)-dependent dehydrogenase (short-subunit alcohol dehydrogenase family)
LLTLRPETATSTDPQPLAGQTALVTGANSGIGRATALGLARRGAHVLLACRSSERAAPVLTEIGAFGGSAAVVPLDLADLDSVRTGAALVADRGQALHLLVNNAGVAGTKGQTAQGFELTFGITHLGHFLLTSLLLDQLRTGAPSRVITVSSAAQNGAKRLDFDTFQRPTRHAAGLVEYQAAKLCNVLFAQELARRLDGQGVTAYSVHPGLVATDIWRSIPRLVRPLVTRWMKTPEDGAARVLHCAIAPLADLENGAYFEKDQPKAPNKIATPDLAAELWKHSEDWTSAWSSP